MKSLYQRVVNFSERNKQYFTNCQQVVIADNLTSLLYSTKIFFVILFLYSIFTFLWMPNPLLTTLYLIFLIAAGALWFFASHYSQMKEPPFASIQKTCMLFLLISLSFTVCISVFPFPKRPGIFYPITYLLVSALFTFPFRQLTLILNSVSIIYLVLVTLFKTPTAASYDCFSCITVWFLDYFLLYVITKLRMRNGEMMQNLELLSRTDLLTGLLNRRGAADIMERNFRRCQKQQISVAAIMLDIDHFKNYNDTLGHAEGDVCLKAFSKILLSYARDLGILAVRYGGEEFLLFLPDCSPENARGSALALLERIRLRAIPGPDGIVTASIGVAAETPGTADTLSDLIKQADAALYHSKENGRNQATIVDLSVDESDAERMVTVKL